MSRTIKHIKLQHHSALLEINYCGLETQTQTREAAQPIASTRSKNTILNGYSTTFAAVFRIYREHKKYSYILRVNQQKKFEKPKMSIL